MNRFGSAKARGRRAVPRTEAPLVVVLETRARRYPTTLVVVSRTGARLVGVQVPQAGDDVQFRAGQVQAYGEVVWAADRQCAIAFDTPIAPAEVERLRSLASFLGAVRAS